ncbi:hypothetical protein B0J14DRAFT_130538 [Halenospora varia]|nr:hypothetical protein B0J14DRAFT_130538 [Halenospora varia]
MASSSNIQDYGPILSAVSIGFLVPTVVVYIWRMTTKFRRNNSAFGFGVDDLMLTCAMIFAIVGVSFGILSVHHGFGKHGAKIKPLEKQKAMFYFWLYQIEYKFQVMFAKLVMLFFFIRVFRADTVFYNRIRVVMVFIVVASIGFATANVFQCTPIKRTWNRAIPGTCINNAAYWISHAVFHITTDLAICLMPIVPVSKLKMAKSKKIAVMAAFGLGSFVCVADAVRIYYLKVSADSTDPTYGASMAVILTTIVSFTAIICICLVTGLRRSITYCCREIRNKGSTGRSAYQLSDVEHSRTANSQQQPWSKSEHRATVGRTESEESIVTEDKDFRPGRDIVKKMSYQVTDDAVTPTHEKAQRL